MGDRWSILTSDIKDAWNIGAAEQKATGDSKLTQYRQSDLCHDHGNRFRIWKSRVAERDNNILPETHGRLSQGSVPRSKGNNAQAFGKGKNCLEFIPQYPGELVEGSPSSSVS